MTFKMKYTWREDFIQKGTLRRSGIKMPSVRFVVVHDTGAQYSTAKNNVDYYKRTANEKAASAQVFIDDKEIVFCMPVVNNPEKAWHVLYNVKKDNAIFGDDANDVAIGVELCYFPNDYTRTLEAYRKYVWFNAWLAYNFKLNPYTSFIGHHLLDPDRKVDPMNALKILKKSYAQLLVDIVNEYMECVAVAEKPVNVIPVKPASIKEENKMTQPIYKPTAKDILNDTLIVLRRLESKEKDGIDAKWRLQLLNGELTESDAIGLLYTALKRGLIQGDIKE